MTTRLKRFLFLCLWFLACLNTSYAQPQEAAELESFIDSLMIAQLEEYQIPGSVVVVVKDGDVLLAKGYGYANIEGNMKVDAQTSLFRIASISKLFTYTAVMQLAEEGMLNLDSSIIEYLDSVGILTIGIDTSTTLKHLMTHTAGFEYVSSGSYGRDMTVMLPLDTLISEQLPPQIRPPGNLAAYSNHGIGLLGLIVEIASGMAWPDYIETHILEPLGMTHSTGHQPVPDTQVEFLATGYRREGGRYQAQDFTFVPLAPAGGMSASGLDMAKFMLAHLQEGEGILEPATAQTMHTTLFQHDPRLSGIAYGFLEKQRNGQRIIGHSGTLPNFISDVWLVPEHELGIFLSYNSSRGKMAQFAFEQAFFDQYFPQSLPPTLSLTDEELQPYTGTYRSTLINLTTSEKLGNLAQSMIVLLGDNGNLQIYSTVMPPMDVVPIGEGIFQDTHSGERVVIKERNGRRHVYVENWPDHAFTEIAWYENPLLHVSLFFIAFMVFVSVLIASARTAVIHHRTGEKSKRLEHWARVTIFMMSSFYLVLIVAVMYSLVVVAYFGTPIYMAAISKVLPFFVILTFVSVLFAGLMWFRKTRQFWFTLHYSLAAVMGLGLSWQLFYFNMITAPW